LFFIGASRENIAAMFRQPREDSRKLCRSLALSENHFRHSGTQSAMVIDFSEAEIFKGKVAQTIYRLIGRKIALAHLLK
jgi:hypothetical protein